MIMELLLFEVTNKHAVDPKTPEDQSSQIFPSHDNFYDKIIRSLKANLNKEIKKIITVVLIFKI